MIHSTDDGVKLKVFKCESFPETTEHFQPDQATYSTTVFAEHNMPGVLVAPRYVFAMVIEVGGRDCTILKVDRAAEALDCTDGSSVALAVFSDV
jgi:hypothetical protein